MDGEEGEWHPYLGAKVMGALFGHKWLAFTLLHSRFLAKKSDCKPSKLCMADKLSITLTPAWLYLPMVRATGEINEYRALARKGKYSHSNVVRETDEQWYRAVQNYLKAWAYEHKEGKEDTWTPKNTK